MSINNIANRSATFTVLAGVGPMVVAWWWVARLTNQVVTEDSTRFSPEWLAIGLIAVVLAASVVAFLGLVRVFRGGRTVLYFAASVVLWIAAFSLGFVTLTSVS